MTNVMSSSLKIMLTAAPVAIEEKFVIMPQVYDKLLENLLAASIETK